MKVKHIGSKGGIMVYEINSKIYVGGIISWINLGIQLLESGD